jgi:hypothetical protein
VKGIILGLSKEMEGLKPLDAELAECFTVRGILVGNMDVDWFSTTITKA